MIWIYELGRGYFVADPIHVSGLPDLKVRKYWGPKTSSFNRSYLDNRYGQSTKEGKKSREPSTLLEKTWSIYIHMVDQTRRTRMFSMRYRWKNIQFRPLLQVRHSLAWTTTMKRLWRRTHGHFVRSSIQRSAPTHRGIVSCPGSSVATAHTG